MVICITVGHYTLSTLENKPRYKEQCLKIQLIKNFIYLVFVVCMEHSHIKSGVIGSHVLVISKGHPVSNG